jgi:hypothetical protein
VLLLDMPDVRVGGAGVPVLPPALANAWAALTRQRVRQLPLVAFLDRGGGSMPPRVHCAPRSVHASPGLNKTELTRSPR